MYDGTTFPRNVFYFQFREKRNFNFVVVARMEIEKFFHLGYGKMREKKNPGKLFMNYKRRDAEIVCLMTSAMDTFYSGRVKHFFLIFILHIS